MLRQEESLLQYSSLNFTSTSTIVQAICMESLRLEPGYLDLDLYHMEVELCAR